MQLYFAIYLREGSMTHEKTDGTKQRNGQPTLGPAVWKTAKGGKTADYNLICCHILTNDEKADKFPCFKANEKTFEIQRRQNHYEIAARDAEENEESDETVNFFDAAQGLKCWKQCKIHKGKAFAGYVKIRVETANGTDVKSDSLFDRYGMFLSELFGTESIFVENTCAGYLNSYFMYGSTQTCIFTVIVGNIPTKRDTQNFLDDCVVLNTYNDYFIRKHDFKCIQIVCGMECYNSCYEMFLKCKKDILDKKVQFSSLNTSNALVIDELVRMNTDAEKELKGILPQNGFYPYNFMFTKLKENLAKRI